MTTRFLWSELVPYRELRSPSLLATLRARRCGLLVAVTPDDMGGLVEMVATVRGAGVTLGLWPMLGRAAGRWANLGNLPAFAAFGHEVLDRAPAFDGPLVIDLEPPIDELEAAVHGHLGRLFRGMTAAPAEVPLLDALLARADRMGLGSLAATVPFVLADRGRQGFQSLLRTPVHGLPFTRVSPMLYTSMVEGYSRGALARADVLALLGWAARHHRERLGGRASVSLGVVGHGILGDEPRYRGPRELAADVAIALHAGIDHLALFSLGGILDRPPVEAWLDAFCQPIPPQTTPRPSATLRAALATAATLAASRALALAAERAPIDGS